MMNERIWQIADELDAEDVKPTYAAILKRLGGGSYSTTLSGSTLSGQLTAGNIPTVAKQASGAIFIYPAANAKVLATHTLPFKAIAMGMMEQGVTWSVVESSGGVISSSGVYTAPSVAGSYHVKATSTSNSAISATVAVTVTVGLINANVVGLAADASGQKLYAAMSYHGIYRSLDSGASRKAANSGLTDPNVKTVTADPSNANNVYVGTGSGAFKSSDAGTTWAPMTVGSISNNAVRSIAVDPKNGQTLFAGTDSGMYFSRDGGATWTAINSGIRVQLGSVDGIGTIAIDPTNSQVLYATSYAFVYKSANGGSIWTKAGPTLVGNAMQMNALVVGPESSVYVAVLDNTAGVGNTGIYKSADGGSSWSKLPLGVTTAIWSLATNPSKPFTVYAGTNSGVYESLGGGSTWALANSNLPADKVTDTTVSALAYLPYNGKLYSGTVYISENGGDVIAALLP